MALEELATKGPMKPEALRGLENLDEYVKAEDLTVINGLKEMPPKTGEREVVDSTHYRTGWLINENLAHQILEETMKGKQMIHKTQVDRKECLSLEQMEATLDTYKGLLMMAYPGYHGLGTWEPARVILEDQEDMVEEGLDATATSLWVVSKELQPPKLFSDYFGKNEKSKFVVKLQKKGAGAPVREPVVDGDTHKAMLSYYYKKQEEEKKLVEDNEDQYLNSAWANTGNMKAAMHGAGNIKWR